MQILAWNCTIDEVNTKRFHISTKCPLTEPFNCQKLITQILVNLIARKCNLHAVKSRKSASALHQMQKFAFSRFLHVLLCRKRAGFWWAHDPQPQHEERSRQTWSCLCRLARLCRTSICNRVPPAARLEWETKRLCCLRASIALGRGFAPFPSDQYRRQVDARRLL